MKELAVTVQRVELYTSVRELPIELSKKMHHYLLQDSGIGTTFQDIDERLTRFTSFIQADKKADALEEAKNLRYALFCVVEEIRFDTPAFGCLIHSVDGKEITDRSTEGLGRLISSLELNNGMVEDILTEVKKNLIKNDSFTSLKSSTRT